MSDLVPVDQMAVLKALSLDPNDPHSVALMLLAQRYQLDPLLGHLFILAGKRGKQVYISRDALLHLAHRSGQFDGMEVDVKEGGGKVVATAKVYRKDMRVPFMFQGECPTSDPRPARAMAIARAERGALKRAFDIQIDVYDPDEDAPAVQARVQAPPPPPLPVYDAPRALETGMASAPEAAVVEPVPGPGAEAPAAADPLTLKRANKLFDLLAKRDDGGMILESFGVIHPIELSEEQMVSLYQRLMEEAHVEAI